LEAIRRSTLSAKSDKSYALVWTQTNSGKEAIYSRVFGPNLCDAP
jgi:hypothetical protein